MPNRPGKGPLYNTPRRRGSIGDLFTSSSSLTVDPEALAQYDEEAAPGTQRAPLFKGERAKLFGLIPYGENPADIANTAFAYEQASGNAANQRTLNLQRLLSKEKLQDDIDREGLLAQRRFENAMREYTAKQDADSRNAVIKAQQDLDAFKARTPAEGERANLLARATTLGGVGAGIDTANLNLADQVFRGGQRNKLTEQKQLAKLLTAIGDPRLAAAVADANRAMVESQGRLSTAQSPLGQRALDLGTRGGYLQQYATALKTGTTELAPGQMSYQDLAPLFSDIGLSYNKFGATPINTPEYATINGMKIPTGESTKSVIFPVSPDEISRARANLNNQPPSVPPAPAAPTPVPTQGSARLPAVSLPPEIQAASNVSQPIVLAREERAAQLMDALGLERPRTSVGRASVPYVNPERYKQVLGQEMFRREAQAKNASPRSAAGRAREKVNEQYLKNLRQLLSEYYE